MKLLLTGANGQVGQEVALLAPAQGWHTLALDHGTLDITDPHGIQELFARFRPDIVINAAAYTAVDAAETHQETAFAVNRDGAVNLATACAHANCPLLHLSTDYVFDGTQSTPYNETDPPAPLGVYGASKWAGEEGIQAILPHHLIFRISWVFGLHGKNFLKTILRLAMEREVLSVVQDQQGGPTPAKAVAQMLLDAADIASRKGFVDWGLYHYCGTPAVSWLEFAEFIVSAAREYQPLKLRELLPITTDQYPTPTQRPANSVMNCERIQNLLGLHPPEWRLFAEEVIKQLHNRVT